MIFLKRKQSAKMRLQGQTVNTQPFPPPPPPFLTQHRLIPNFQTIELMEMLKITVLVHVRRSQAEDIEWGNDLGVMWESDPITNGHHLGIAAMLEKNRGVETIQMT